MWLLTVVNCPLGHASKHFNYPDFLSYGYILILFIYFLIIYKCDSTCTTMDAVNQGDVADSISNSICMNILSWLLICRSVKSLIYKGWRAGAE